MSESSSKLPFPGLQHKSESSRELFQAAPAQAEIDWKLQDVPEASCSAQGTSGGTGTPLRSQGRAGNSVLDAEQEQQSSSGFSPLLPSLLPCSQRNVIKM